MSETASNQQDLIELYRLARDNTEKTSERRIISDQIYVGINAVLLSGVLTILVGSHLTTWVAPGLLAFLSVFGMLINVAWNSAQSLLRQILVAKFEYLARLEAELPRQARQFTSEWEYVRQASLPRLRLSERLLPQIFFWLYPLITCVVSILTYFITNHFLPPLSW
jgi:hypothetical protein